MSDAEPRRDPVVLSPLLAALFEPGVAAAQWRVDSDAEFSDRNDAGRLCPSEAEFATDFAPKRRAEFTAGRLCAHRALAELGIMNVAIGVNSDRSPQWPPAVVGSITHTTGLCGAVVASSRRFAGIGIDAETIGRVTRDIHSLVFTAQERLLLGSLHDDLQARATTIIFSAKEAFYKCQYAVTREWRDFTDISLELVTSDMYAGDFIVRPACTTTVTQWGIVLPLRGRFWVEGNIAVTGIATRSDAAG